MKQVQAGSFKTSVIGLGCMRIAHLPVQEVEQLVGTALDQGINLFDHADIYGSGECGMLFGKVLKRNPDFRSRMVIQSKCGIRKGFYDFSYKHLMASVDGILTRLQIDALDTLLFHRPDLLAEEEEVARAVQDLKAQGKVRQFGVSNMNPAQIQLLESWTGERMVVDQAQLSLVHAGMIASGFNVNVTNAEGTMYNGNVLPFCQQSGITIQAWSPLQHRGMKECFIGNERFPDLNKKLDELAQQYNVTPAAIALAWLLRIPGRMQVLIGTTNVDHLKEECEAANIELTRQEWYALYRSCGYLLP